ncbi:hypothetical protein B0J12DRAFT_764562 [Macrophomina phaseolina]|uniref:Uncharacterized protein n=1 Tax=Macrophomina phaseolina TaxID=35725 RepID=A0ABQ8G042_9PEZI|nr:hypothetical protein B0J12DRAFT_764562 [Macrophomina phaseolina]
MTQDSRGQNMTSYENLRATGDPGNELEGRANPTSTQNQSGTFSNPSSRHLGRHSGYDGHSLFFEQTKNERLLTPTEEVRRNHSIPQETSLQQHGGLAGSPSHKDTYKNKSKHKSNISSLFGIPKVSRWSKIAASTEESTRNGKKGRPYSNASRFGSNINLNEYDDHPFEQAQSPSPLIPDHGMDDPKYQAHRNSLNLKHPQPHPSPTHHYQTYLESQAMSFDDPQSPGFDQWSSAPSLALNRNRFSNNNGHMSPFPDGGYSNHSAMEQVRRQMDDGHLVP